VPVSSRHTLHQSLTPCVQSPINWSPNDAILHLRVLALGELVLFRADAGALFALGTRVCILVVERLRHIDVKKISKGAEPSKDIR
jgi:hypothetical protein